MSLPSDELLANAFNRCMMLWRRLHYCFSGKQLQHGHSTWRTGLLSAAAPLGWWFCSLLYPRVATAEWTTQRAAFIFPSSPHNTTAPPPPSHRHTHTHCSSTPSFPRHTTVLPCRHGGEAADVATAALGLVSDLLALTVNWFRVMGRGLLGRSATSTAHRYLEDHLPGLHLE